MNFRFNSQQDSVSDCEKVHSESKLVPESFFARTFRCITSLLLLLTFGIYTSPEAHAQQTITLTPSSGEFGSAFTATASGFDKLNVLILFLQANPSSAPADCQAVQRNVTGLLATASTGTGDTLTVTNLVASRYVFVLGSENYLCFMAPLTGVSSPVVQFTVLPPP